MPVVKTVGTDVKRVAPAAIRPPDSLASGKRRGTSLRVALWTVNIAIVLAVGLVVLDRFKQRASDEGDGTTAKPAVPVTPPTPATPKPVASKEAPSATPVTPVSEMVTTNAAPATTVPKGPKLIGDLKVSQITLDQPKGAKGSRLVYVTGILKNESDHQRFGVRVEFDLLDATGNKVGSATEYRQSLEPRATWQFRAIVTDKRATGAKLATVKEDE